MCGYVHLSAEDALGGQKWNSDPLGLESQAVVSYLTSVLGAKLGPSVRAVHALQPLDMIIL